MAREVESLGLHACLAQSIMDFGEGLPTYWVVRIAQECMQSQKELYERHHDIADGRVRMWLRIKQIMNCADELRLAMRDTARELKIGIHMYVAEIPSENQLVIETRNVDHGTVIYLEKGGFL